MKMVTLYNSIYFGLFIITLMSIPINATSQKQEIEKVSSFDGSKNVIFMEFLGNGLVFSVNCDVRVIKKFGLRAGIGYFYSNNTKTEMLTLPLMGNFLLGKNGNYLEVGAGITYAKGSGKFSDLDLEHPALLGAFSFMYRRQPVNRGLMWKIGFTPMINEGKFLRPYYGISLGACW